MASINKRKFFRNLLCIALSFTTFLLSAAPHAGDTYMLSQPDGRLVECRVFGDEFYQDVETPDGYTLIRDGAGWICYARLGSDGMSYLSTGIVYDPGSASATGVKSSLAKKARIKKEAIWLASKKRHDTLLPAQPQEDEGSGVAAMAEGIEPAPPSVTLMSGTYTGLTILIDFPDKRGTVGKQEIDNFCNQAGYSNYSNNGSIRDYFGAISSGNITYLNRVTDYITTNNNFSYYDQNCDYCMVRELVNEILNKLVNSGFDFSGLSTTSGRFTAINLLYAGAPAQGWAKGLWPHSGSLDGSFSVNGIKAVRYQLSNIGTELSLSTFAHENGHMLLGWPDVYAYDGHDNGVGYYEEGSNKKNPSLRNPYFRYLKGWCQLTDISNASPGSVFALAANGNVACYYSNRSDGRELFLIETIRRTGRNANLPDEGLAIWHVNTAGDNTTSSKPNLISIEQADGLAQIENKVNNGGAGDLFHAGDKTTFNDNTNPSAKWTDGTVSGIDINGISAVADTMSFTYKTGNSVTPEPTAAPTTPPTSNPTVAPTPAPTQAGLKADVNGSGAVDIVDALLVAQFFVGLNPANFNQAVADANCSGGIDIVDALLISQYFVGLIGELPC